MVKEGILSLMLEAIRLGGTARGKERESAVYCASSLSNTTYSLLEPLTLAPLSWTMRPCPSIK